MNGQPLWQQLSQAPVTGDADRAAAFMADLTESWRNAGIEQSAIERLNDPAVSALLAGALMGSRHLNMMLLQDPVRAHRVLWSDPAAHLAQLIGDLHVQSQLGPSQQDWMKQLRAFKSETALLVALADLGGVWPIMQVTDAITQIADAAVSVAVAYLFAEAVRKGDWAAEGEAPADRSSGYFVLAMGKHGAFELNYSSDVDLIVFYDAARARITGDREAAAFFVKMTRDLVRLLNERTPDGYVFRTDLRLRPDPGATQVAMSVDSALHYYESFGQNWERAAMIKARPIAGDIAAGNAFLRELAPFIWRKYLDFAAISDIHAMKRQIHAHRGFSRIAVAGHNIKLGRGGIREIEFFTQTQQLIAGGRQPELRTRETLKTLQGLADRGWITPQVAADMIEAYQFLRSIEHRIQMVADEQTHQLPKETEALAAFAQFAGFETLDAFSAALLKQLETVQKHYSALFEDGPELSSTAANLVLAGEDDDPDTVASLAAMGFSQPTQVLNTIRTWHRGRYPAVRSEGARARLTEVQPVLVEALAKTVDPDAALIGFDRFLSTLPAGVQLFALLKAHPELMRLVALIMGSAPRLAQILSRHRRVFDAVLDPRIIGALPTEDEVRSLIEDELGGVDELEAILDRARVIGREQMFLIGIRLLTGLIEADEAGPAYTLIAEELIRRMHEAVDADFQIQHGKVPGGASCVVAMGRLGGYEMTATSDVDLIVVYDYDAAAKASDGPRPLAVNTYYARLTQRLISAISALTAEGRLYEVDMRLRPSGNKGPVATQFSSFENYQRNEAWTWEHMALTRARVISGPEPLKSRIEDAVRRTLTEQRDRSKLLHDVRDMRERIWSEKGTHDIWALKQARGGLIDVEFIAQFLQLAHAADHDAILDTNTIASLQRAMDIGLIALGDGERLIEAARLQVTLIHLLRICSEDGFDPENAPDGLKSMLASACSEPDLGQVEVKLVESQATIRQLYDKWLQ